MQFDRQPDGELVPLPKPAVLWLNTIVLALASAAFEYTKSQARQMKPAGIRVELQRRMSVAVHVGNELLRMRKRNAAQVAERAGRREARDKGVALIGRHDRRRGRLTDGEARPGQIQRLRRCHLVLDVLPAIELAVDDQDVPRAMGADI